MREARNTDPQTSHAAGENVRRRALPQRDLLLLAYLRAGSPSPFAGDGWVGGLTDEEAGILTGLIEKPGCCYWKRCSELRQEGLIEVFTASQPDQTGHYQRVPLTRISRAGEQQQVCVLTADGAARAKQLRIIYGDLPPRHEALKSVVEVDSEYLEWLEGVAASASLVAKFDGTERESLDVLRAALWNRGPAA
jgi:hypothetical protein